MWKEKGNFSLSLHPPQYNSFIKFRGVICVFFLLSRSSSFILSFSHTANFFCFFCSHSVLSLLRLITDPLSNVTSSIMSRMEGERERHEAILWLVENLIKRNEFDVFKVISYRFKEPFPLTFYEMSKVSIIFWLGLICSINRCVRSNVQLMPPVDMPSPDCNKRW